MKTLPSKFFAAACVITTAASLAIAPASHAQSKSSTTEQRIVTLGGSITEIVFMLGASDQVVGVDQSSHFPAAAEKLPKVGLFRAVSAEGVLALRPTIVIGTADAGPPPALAQIRGAGVKVVQVKSEESAEGALDKIRGVAAAIGLPERGDSLANEIAKDIEQSRKVISQVKEKPRVLFIYARGAGTLLVAGKDNPADAMIKLAHAQNAVTEFSGFKPLTAEAVLAAKPDVILVPEHGLQSVGNLEGFLKLPGVALTPAGKNKRIVSLNDELLLGFGPRIAQAVRMLAVELHPQYKAELSSSAAAK